MHYFDRTNKLSNILFISSIVSFIISLVVMFNGKGLIIFVIWFVISILTLIIGIALKCIVKDAKDELDIIKKVYCEK